MATPTVKGRNASPACSGEKSSTRWRYSVLKKNIAKRPEATSSMTTFAARSVRTLKMLSRTSGSGERRSIITKAVRMTTASARKPTVCADPQPFSAVETIP